jgi:hypothetical protein
MDRIAILATSVKFGSSSYLMVFIFFMIFWSSKMPGLSKIKELAINIHGTIIFRVIIFLRVG